MGEVREGGREGGREGRRDRSKAEYDTTILLSLLAPSLLPSSGRQRLWVEKNSLEGGGRKGGRDYRWLLSLPPLLTRQAAVNWLDAESPDMVGREGGREGREDLLPGTM